MGGPASILKMKNHSGVEKISDKMPESDEINDTVESIVNNSTPLTTGDKNYLVRSSSSDNNKKYLRKGKYSDTSSDSGSHCNGKSQADVSSVKRRKRRKRPSDPKSKAMKQKAADIEKALRRSYNNPSASSLSDDSQNKESDALVNQIMCRNSSKIIARTCNIRVWPNQ